MAVSVQRLRHHLWLHLSNCLFHLLVQVEEQEGNTLDVALCLSHCQNVGVLISTFSLEIWSFDSTDSGPLAMVYSPKAGNSCAAAASSAGVCGHT